MKEIKEWTKKIFLNPELAKKHFCRLTGGVIERVENYSEENGATFTYEVINSEPFDTAFLNESIKYGEPHITAYVIQFISFYLTEWVTDADQYSGFEKRKRIKDYIDIITMILECNWGDKIEHEAVEKVRIELTKQLEYLKDKETETEQETIQIKPKFIPEAVTIVIDILKNYFDKNDQTELKRIIETGNKANKKLLFEGNGNILTDTFKKLIEHNFIIRCQKLDLIDWIVSNFEYMYRNKVKKYTRNTVSKIISQNNQPCKYPLIEIENGKIQKVEQPRTKKYNNY